MAIVLCVGGAKEKDMSLQSKYPYADLVDDVRVWYVLGMYGAPGASWSRRYGYSCDKQSLSLYSGTVHGQPTNTDSISGWVDCKNRRMGWRKR